MDNGKVVDNKGFTSFDFMTGLNDSIVQVDSYASSIGVQKVMSYEVGSVVNSRGLEVNVPTFVAIQVDVFFCGIEAGRIGPVTPPVPDDNMGLVDVQVQGKVSFIDVILEANVHILDHFPDDKVCLMVQKRDEGSDVRLDKNNRIYVRKIRRVFPMVLVEEVLQTRGENGVGQANVAVNNKIDGVIGVPFGGGICLTVVLVMFYGVQNVSDTLGTGNIRGVGEITKEGSRSDVGINKAKNISGPIVSTYIRDKEILGSLIWTNFRIAVHTKEIYVLGLLADTSNEANGDDGTVLRNVNCVLEEDKMSDLTDIPDSHNAFKKINVIPTA